MNNCCVYEHENLTNGKRYFGITTRNPITRWGNGGTGYKSNQHFWSAIQKYGWDEGFSHKILFDGLSESEAREIEEILITDYETHDPEHGYNNTFGGELERPNEETRRKMSEAQKGKTLNEETRRKISENNAMKRPEVRRKNSEVQKGKHLSEEHRRKISANHADMSGENNTMSRPVEAINPETGLRAHCFDSVGSAGRAGFRRSHISECCNGKRKTHKGYIWRFVESEGTK